MSNQKQCDTMRELFGLNYDNLKRMKGGIAFAVGELIDCHPMRKEDEDKAFVEFNPSLFCHVYKNVCPIKPFEWKGSQGWKKLDQSTINKIKYL